MDAKAAEARFDLLNQIRNLSELSISKKLRLHGLQGEWKGFWSIDINGPWRVFFQMYEEDVYEVTIQDPH